MVTAPVTHQSDDISICTPSLVSDPRSPSSSPILPPVSVEHELTMSSLNLPRLEPRPSHMKHDSNMVVTIMQSPTEGYNLDDQSLRTPHKSKKGPQELLCRRPMCPSAKNGGPKKFTRSSDLKRHNDTVHDEAEGRYQCNFCGHRAPRRDKLTEHCRRKHPKEIEKHEDWHLFDFQPTIRRI